MLVEPGGKGVNLLELRLLEVLWTGWKRGCKRLLSMIRSCEDEDKVSVVRDWKRELRIRDIIVQKARPIWLQDVNCLIGNGRGNVFYRLQRGLSHPKVTIPINPNGV